MFVRYFHFLYFSRVQSDPSSYNKQSQSNHINGSRNVKNLTDPIQKYEYFSEMAGVKLNVNTTNVNSVNFVKYWKCNIYRQWSCKNHSDYFMCFSRRDKSSGKCHLEKHPKTNGFGKLAVCNMRKILRKILRKKIVRKVILNKEIIRKEKEGWEMSTC